LKDGIKYWFLHRYFIFHPSDFRQDC